MLNRGEAQAWQQSWDRQQEAFMPDREHRFAAMIDTVEAACGGAAPVRVLDLAGGTGSISSRVLRRRPDAEVTLLDLDPVLTEIAAATLPTVRVVAADLRDPGWSQGLGTFDAVLTATALHWLDAERLAELYREVFGLTRPGGVFINADHMPDDRLPVLSGLMHATDKLRRDRLYATGAAISWESWWDLVAADSVLGPLKARRDDLFSIHHAQEWLPDVSWHVSALHDAGFTEVGLVWRGGLDAAVAACRAA